ncbi:uncharacterized protein LOC141852549 [Brevipalpus obovatus]|uniref:uncharacterized protein LOC141852549 n=1 Tax=Brevipalpus obovatus TaxID=246614 RepID=UPI003D9E45E3
MMLKVFFLLVLPLIIVRADEWEEALNKVKNDRLHFLDTEDPLIKKAELWMRMDDWSSKYSAFAQKSEEFKKRIEAVQNDPNTVLDDLNEILEEAEDTLEALMPKPAKKKKFLFF